MQGMKATPLMLAAGLAALLAVVAVTLVLSPPGPTTATGTNSITRPDTSGDDVGLYTSLALDASGHPVVSYFDVNHVDLKVLHCNDADCAGGDESITVPDAASSAGLYSSLALDASGYPVVSYYDNSSRDLKVLHCNDADCAGGDESITSPDTGGDVGQYTSLALDASGHAVVSYYDGANGDLKVLHCDDPNCSGDEGTNITSPDTGGNVGWYTSLALDASGHPVVSYYDSANGDLKVLHCGNPACTSGNTITAPDTAGDVGAYTSLALDISGNPVVSYHDATYGDLAVLHCSDANCSDGYESIEAPDTGSGVDWDVGLYTSLALDTNGFPVISYYNRWNSFNLKVLHCDDRDCTGDESANISAPDTVERVGAWTSLALDANDNPVVSYVEETSQDTRINFDLKVLHCGDADCSGAKPAPTPFPTPTAPPTPTAEPGDVNCDGTVNSVDAALVLQLDAGLIGSLACQENADVNEDGTVNSLDAALILQYDAGLIDNLGLSGFAGQDWLARIRSWFSLPW